MQLLYSDTLVTDLTPTSLKNYPDLSVYVTEVSKATIIRLNIKLSFKINLCISVYIFWYKLCSDAARPGYIEQPMRGDVGLHTGCAVRRPAYCRTNTYST